MMYLIWSFEHGAWWRPFGWGYTQDIDAAGRFNLEEASSIIENANRYRPLDDPFEVLVPIDEIAEFRESFLV
jgi:hypothetical protein